MKITTTLVLLLTAFKLYSGAITITNDTDHRIIVIDPRSSEALILAPNELAVIDPTITNLITRYFLLEKLDIYFPDRLHPKGFFKKYRVTESYHPSDFHESALTVSQIVNLVNNPSDRFKVREYQLIEKTHYPIQP